MEFDGLLTYYIETFNLKAIFQQLYFGRTR